jgi:ubiquitin-protein ligase
MTAHSTRREQDVQKLRALSSSSNGKIKINKVTGSPPNSIELELVYPTAGDRNYPNSVQKITNVIIELGSRYPFAEPKVVIKTPILHPNVYASGQVCLGAKWLPSQGLDLLVKRLISIVTYDESILNEKSPANRDALKWYSTALRSHPHAFPTTKMSPVSSVKPSGITWTNTK